MAGVDASTNLEETIAKITEKIGILESKIKRNKEQMKEIQRQYTDKKKGLALTDSELKRNLYEKNIHYRELLITNLQYKKTIEYYNNQINNLTQVNKKIKGLLPQGRLPPLQKQAPLAQQRVPQGRLPPLQQRAQQRVPQAPLRLAPLQPEQKNSERKDNDDKILGTIINAAKSHLTYRSRYLIDFINNLEIILTEYDRYKLINSDILNKFIKLKNLLNSFNTDLTDLTQPADIQNITTKINFLIEQFLKNMLAILVDNKGFKKWLSSDDYKIHIDKRLIEINPRNEEVLKEIEEIEEFFEDEEDKHNLIDEYEKAINIYIEGNTLDFNTPFGTGGGVICSRMNNVDVSEPIKCDEAPREAPPDYEDFEINLEETLLFGYIKNDITSFIILMNKVINYIDNLALFLSNGNIGYESIVIVNNAIQKILDYRIKYLNFVLRYVEKYSKKEGRRVDIFSTSVVSKDVFNIQRNLINYNSFHTSFTKNKGGRKQRRILGRPRKTPAKPVKKPATKPVKPTKKPPATKPVAKPVKKPAAKPAKPAKKSPATKPVAKPVKKPATKPAKPAKPTKKPTTTKPVAKTTKK